MRIWLPLLVAVLALSSTAAQAQEPSGPEPSGPEPSGGGGLTAPPYGSPLWTCGAWIDGKESWTVPDKQMRLCTYATAAGKCFMLQRKDANPLSWQVGIICVANDGTTEFHDYAGAEPAAGTVISGVPTDQNCTSCHQGDNGIINTPALEGGIGTVPGGAYAPVTPPGKMPPWTNETIPATPYPSCAACHTKLPSIGFACAEVIMPAIGGNPPYMPPEGANADSAAIMAQCCTLLKTGSELGVLQANQRAAYKKFCQKKPEPSGEPSGGPSSTIPGTTIPASTFWPTTWPPAEPDGPSATTWPATTWTAPSSTEMPPTTWPATTWPPTTWIMP